MANYHHGDLAQALIDATVAVIEREGPHALSLRKAARMAGVSHAAPAHHFGDLRGLLAAVAERGYEGILSAMRQPVPGRLQLDRLRQIGRGYIEFAANNRGLFRAMFHPELARDSRPNDAHRRAAKRTFDYLVAVVEACQHEGTVRQGDAIEFATLAWAAVHGASALLIDHQLPIALESADEVITRALYRGLVPRDRLEP